MSGTQHAGLTEERWRQFTLDQQILMIANGMHRAGKLLLPGDAARRSDSYERVLRLADLTVRATGRRGLRRELLRWRELVGELYLAGQPSAREHASAFRALLLITPTAAAQIQAPGVT